MSEPAAPHVQVFHFTSRISSAKIAKYKLATEKGMGGGPARDSTPAPAIKRASPSTSLAVSTQDPPTAMGPPTKKARLKLSVRKPGEDSVHRSQSHSPDTIAVSRPKRDSSLKAQYTEDLEIDHDSMDTSMDRQKFSPTASSELSSLSSVPPLDQDTVSKQTSISATSTSATSTSRDYSKDFMSYYVTGGDDEDEEVQEVAAPPKAATPSAPANNTEPAKQAPVQAPQVPQETRFKHHTVPPPYPPAKAPPARPPPPPVPQIKLIDTIIPVTSPKEPDTVAVMIKKLEHLSQTLTEFGGVPAIPRSPTLEAQRVAKPRKVVPNKTSGKKEAAVDNFLAMFDDDESDEKDESDINPVSDDNRFDYKLPISVENDEPLKYGIQFIQNALRSWAYQRVTAQVGQHYQQIQMQQRADSQPQKRGPGRPRKFDLDDEQSSFTQNPPLIQFDLAKQPEGTAILAFQEVLDSGCLRINATLPIELSRALRHLYMQIDHLINQGARAEPQWRCMSYGAQITAHRIRVEKWKEQQARAQQEMARQQQLAAMQVMQQMGLPTNVPHMSMTPAQAQQAHAIDLERRRDLQYAAQQPHLARFITNPMSLDTGSTTHVNNSEMNRRTSGSAPASANTSHSMPTQTSTTVPSPPAPVRSGSTMAPANGTSSKSPFLGSTSQAQSTAAPTNNAPPASPLEVATAHIDKIKMYTANLLSRSGQTMKFSFPPQSPRAAQAFGQDAFPRGSHATSSKPNRGPMMTPPQPPAKSLATTHPPHQVNGSTPTLDSNAPAGSPHLTNGSRSDTIEVATRPPSRPASQPPTANSTAVAKAQSNATLPTQSSMMGSFDSAKASGRPRRPSTGSAASPPTMPPPPPPKINETAIPSHMTSRFPHPGAVVMDQ